MSSGSSANCKYEVRNNLLNFSWVDPHITISVVEYMMDHIRRLSRKEDLNPIIMESIGRLARMSQELLRDGTLSMLDITDMELLEDLPINQETEWVHFVARMTGNQITNTHIPISHADHMAKSLHIVHES